MAQIGLNPYIISDVTLKVASNNYEVAVSQVEFQPQGGVVTWKGLTPASVYTFPQAVTWQCVLAFAQDYETEDSLSNFLFEHKGETVSVEFQPRRTGAKTVYADVVVVPGGIGGAGDAVAATTVTLGVVGEPSFTAPTGS